MYETTCSIIYGIFGFFILLCILGAIGHCKDSPAWLKHPWRQRQDIIDELREQNRILREKK